MKHLQFLIIIVILFASCKKQCPPFKTDHLPSKGFIVSYTGKDTLKFLRNGNDTFTFIGAGWVVSETDLTDQNCDGCCTKDQLLAQQRHVRFADIKDSKNTFTITETYTRDTTINIDVSYTYKNSVHELNMKQSYFTGHQTYTVLGKKYSDVYQTTSDDVFQWYGDVLLFSLQNGIIRYELTNYQAAKDVIELIP